MRWLYCSALIDLLATKFGPQNEKTGRNLQSVRSRFLACLQTFWNSRLSRRSKFFARQLISAQRGKCKLLYTKIYLYTFIQIFATILLFRFASGGRRPCRLLAKRLLRFVDFARVLRIFSAAAASAIRKRCARLGSGKERLPLQRSHQRRKTGIWSEKQATAAKSAPD